MAHLPGQPKRGRTVSATLDYPAALRLFRTIRDEPRCAEHECPHCYPKDAPMTKPQIALRIAKYAVIAWAVLAVVFLAAAMVFGEQLP